MVKDSRQKEQGQVSSLKGEGLRVPFKVQQSGVRNGVTSATGEVSFKDITAPDRRFVADCFELRVHPGGFAQWLFGQTQIDGKNLRALLDLRYPLQGMESVAALFKRYAFESPPSSDTSQFSRVFESEPAQTLALEVNLTRVSASRHSSVVDFFHSSGLGMNEVLVDAHIFVMPIVRVLVPFDLMHQLAQEVQKKFPVQSPASELKS